MGGDLRMPHVACRGVSHAESPDVAVPSLTFNSLSIFFSANRDRGSARLVVVPCNGTCKIPTGLGSVDCVAVGFVVLLVESDNVLSTVVSEGDTTSLCIVHARTYVSDTAT